MPIRFFKPHLCIGLLKVKEVHIFGLQIMFAFLILVTRMVAAPPMKAFGKDETHGAALVHGQGEACPCPGVSTLEPCL